MRGTLKQQSMGSWTLILDVGRDPATGKRRQQWHTVKGTKRQAEAKLAEIIHQVDTGTPLGHPQGKSPPVESRAKRPSLV